MICHSRFGDSAVADAPPNAAEPFSDRGGRAVLAPIADLAHPLGDLCLECRPANEAMVGDGVTPHVADAARILTLLPSQQLQVI
jgi:hypothetical protein